MSDIAVSVTRRRWLSLAFSVGMGLLVPPVDAFARPVLLIFPSGYGKLVPVATGSEVNDGLTDYGRILKAAQVVRSLLTEEAAVDAVLFDKEQPAMVRALAESKVVAGPAEFTEEQKLRIGSAFGANYVVSVNARGGAELMQIDEQVARINAAGRQSFDNAGGQANAKGSKGDKPRPVLPNLPVVAGPSLEIDAVEVRRNGKRWKDRITIGGQEAQSLADLAQKQPAYPTALASAARSLVLRFLNGPLRDARLAAVDRSLLPPPAAPAPTVSQAEIEGKPADPVAEAAELIRKADVLRRDGLPGQAVLQLRQAVSTNPRAAAPRMALMRAYADLGKGADAADEARRALQLARDLTDDDRRELAQVVARGLAEGQSPLESKAAFEAAIKANPDSIDTRLAYADLLLQSGETASAEVQFRIVRKKDPSSTDASRGLGRIVAARGDLDEALKEAADTGHPLGRWTFATVVFLDAASPIAVRIAQTRSGWEAGQVSREAFYKSVNAQSERASRLVALLTTSPPPETASETEQGAHRRRVLAATLLSQAVSTLANYLETGDAASGVRSRTLIEEFLREMKNAADPPKVPIPARPSPAKPAAPGTPSGTGTPAGPPKGP